MRPDLTGRVRIASRLKDQIAKQKFDPGDCVHFAEIDEVVPSAKGCEDCLKIGDDWVHLRICLTCGHVGCCDNSKNKHATRHYHETHHPMVASYEIGEHWIWCYPDELFFQV